MKMQWFPCKVSAHWVIMLVLDGGDRRPLKGNNDHTGVKPSANTRLSESYLPRISKRALYPGNPPIYYMYKHV